MSSGDNVLGRVLEGDGWVNWSELATLDAPLGQALLKSLNRIGQGAH
jgi:hypothetical protein